MRRRLGYLRLIARLAVALLAAGVLEADSASTGDWSSFRGPRMDQTVSGTGLFPPDPKVRLEVIWKRPLGSGYSGISIQGETAVTLFSDRGSDFVAAFDIEDGRERWRFELDTTHPGRFGSQNGPISTPLIAGETVVALAPGGRLVAVSLDSGERIWQTDLVEDLGAEAPFYGFATSPILVSGLVIVQTGSDDVGAVTALDPANGEVRWRSARGTVQYQSPAVTTIDGKERLLFMGSKQLAALDPETGSVLWVEDFEGDAYTIGSGSSNVVIASDQRILFKDTASSNRLVRLGGEDSNDGTADVWTTRNLKNSYVVPVYHEGFFYGYNGRFLSCVHADSGERVWRSRSPGDGFPILIDGHLVIATKDGVLSAAKASPEGYQEITSLQLFDDLVWTPASFGAGSLFLRSMGEMARVAVVSAESSSLANRSPRGMIPDSAFGHFLEELNAAEDKASHLESYLASQGRFPIIEDDSLAHFVYRGPEQDVALISDFIGARADEPMHRVPGTDLFYYSTRLEPDARVFYWLLKDFDEVTVDPLNPSKVPLGAREISVLAMPEWSEPAHLREPEGPRGRIESLELPAVEGQDVKSLDVYLPVGYDSSERHYPVVYVHAGRRALEKGLMANTLDNVLGDTVEPLLAVFMPTFDPFFYREMLGTGKDEYARRIVREIVPLVDRTYRTIPLPEARASVGQSAAAFASFYTTVTHPGVFGKLGLQSIIWEPGYAPQNEALLAGPLEQPLTIYADWNKYGIHVPFEGMNGPEQSRSFAKVLQENGYGFTGREWNEADEFVCWRIRTDQLLEALFPADRSN